MRLTFLRPLYEAAGPYASVYLETSRASEDAKKAVPLRWEELRAELSGLGADPATLDRLGEAVTSPGLAAPGVAAFGRSGAVPFTAKLPAPPVRQLARWAPLPHLMPLLAASPPREPYLLVSADRSGGDIVAVRTADDATKASVQGTGWPVHKSRARPAAGRSSSTSGRPKRRGRPTPRNSRAPWPARRRTPGQS